jgi:hypothetical protein
MSTKHLFTLWVEGTFNFREIICTFYPMQQSFVNKSLQSLSPFAAKNSSIYNFAGNILCSTEVKYLPSPVNIQFKSNW